MSRKEKKILTDQQIETLMAAAGGGPLGSRMRGIMAFMWLSGLRISEVLDLRISDIDWSKNLVRVRNGKGGESGKSPMPNALRPYLDAWLAHRSKVDLSKTAPLFCVLSKNPGKPIHPKAIWLRMKELGRKIFGEEEPCHPHMLRRTCATRKLRQGYDLTKVARMLRHKTTASTHHYLALVDVEELAQEMKDD